MSKDWVKSLLPTISSLMCIATFVLSLWKGRLSKLGVFDTIVLALGIVASLVWWQFKSATYTNLILQGCIIIGFIPTFTGTWIKPDNEKPLPWMIWTVAYALGIAIVVLRWHGQYQDLAYPVECVIAHGAIGWLSTRKLPGEFNDNPVRCMENDI